MIVLGPLDADLCGAPHYWREGNWRPPLPMDIVAGSHGLGLMPSIPFDRCDAVLVYDARDPDAPLPRDQGWDEKTSGIEPRHEAEQGTLLIEAGEGDVLGYLGAETGRLERMPQYAVCTTVFAKDATASEDRRARGWEAMVAASGEGRRARGMAMSWNERFVYRSLDGARTFPFSAAVSHDTLHEVWHAAALDGQLLGFRVNRDEAGNVEAEDDDGGRTINSLDSLINNEPRVVFGYGDAPDRPTLFASFGKPEEAGIFRGRVRRFAASAPGRFMRAEFRAAALAERVRLRLVLYAEGGSEREEPLRESAAFRIAWASGDELRPNALPQRSLTVARAFDPSDAWRIVEVAAELGDLKPGEPLWFALERDWRSDEDGLRATVHLLQVIVEAVR